jgi:hypothetical protein
VTLYCMYNLIVGRARGFAKKDSSFFVVSAIFSVTLRVVAAVGGSYCLLCILYIHYLSTITMPVGGGFARFSRMPPPRTEGDTVESVEETPVSQKDDSMVEEDPNAKIFDDFGDDFGLPMDNLGDGMDFDNNVDDSLMGGWGETEVCNITPKYEEALPAELSLTMSSHFSTAV